jgi:hypothetical protein
MTSLEQGRREELAAALARVRRRITTVCAAAGRDPAEVRLRHWSELSAPRGRPGDARAPWTYWSKPAWTATPRVAAAR